MTLAGWDEKASLAAASDPQTPTEILHYFLSPDNLRPKLLPALLENPSIPETELVKFALSASRESLETLLKSPRIRALAAVLDAMRSNPYLTKEGSQEIVDLLHVQPSGPAASSSAPEHGQPQAASHADAEESPVEVHEDAPAATHDEEVSTYIAEHAGEIAAEEGKPFQPVGGIVDLLGADYFPVQVHDVPEPVAVAAPASAESPSHGPVTAAKKAPLQPAPAKRENTMQKINALDVKGRIQLALKGNKEERSILIRDGTKVVALAVLEAPKLSDGEVEKFALQKNVLEAVLRQIPLKRRFMKNYIVVRNLVSNPRTPLDLGLGLMKHLLTQDLKNISANKEVSETVRKLALKMYKQKLDAANKK
jgi:hypothetical protein